MYVSHVFFCFVLYTTNTNIFSLFLYSVRCTMYIQCNRRHNRVPRGQRQWSVCESKCRERRRNSCLWFERTRTTSVVQPPAFYSPRPYVHNPHVACCAKRTATVTMDTPAPPRAAYLPPAFSPADTYVPHLACSCWVGGGLSRPQRVWTSTHNPIRPQPNL